MARYTQNKLLAIYDANYNQGQSDYFSGQTYGNTRTAYDNTIAERYSENGYKEGWNRAETQANKN